MSVPLIMPQVSASAEWVQLSARQRTELGAMLGLMQRIDGVEVKRLAFSKLAQKGSRKLSESCLRNKYYAWVAAGRDWRVLVDRRRNKKDVRMGAVGHIYKRYCEDDQRTSFQAWLRMLGDFRAGVHFDNVGSWVSVWVEQMGDEQIPAVCPADWVPNGWSYQNLQQRYGLTKFEEKATRIGMKAAREFILPVLKSRIGLLPGMQFEGDDKHHNVIVNYEGQPEGLRPLEFVIYDVASGSRVASGIRPTMMDAVTGKKDRLKEKEFLFLVVHLLTVKGFHRDGCVFGVEWGTAAIRPDREKAIGDVSGGLVKFSRSGILGEQVHQGLFGGRGGGNPQFKPLVESLHGLDHNILAALPGQVGMDREHCPEWLHGLSRYNRELVVAAAQISPEQRQRLTFPVIEFHQWLSVVNELYTKFDRRWWHNLEGWVQNEWMVTEYRHGYDGNWFPMQKLCDLQGNDRAAIEAFIQAHPEHVRTRRLSPHEVWRKGEAELTRIPGVHTPELLGYELGKRLNVRDDGTIIFEDRYLGPGRHVYHATVTTPDGFVQSLARGAEYLSHVTPYAPERMWISDVVSGRVLGMAQRYDVAPRTDVEAIKRLMGAQAHDIKVQSDPIRARHQHAAEKRMAMIRNNKEVIGEAELEAATGRVHGADEDVIPQDVIAEILRNENIDTYWKV